MGHIFLDWEGFSALLGLGLFAGYIIVDGLYVYYTLTVTNKRPFAAASSGAVIHLLIALGVLSYVENFLYIMPIALGSWVGTYVVVKSDFFVERTTEIELK